MLNQALRLYPFARKLPLAFEPDRLRTDLAAIDESWWARHLGPFHDGGWESVSLWSPGGSVRMQRSTGGAFAATRALHACPYIAEVLDAFPGTRNRIRLMRLKAGARILRHSDPLHTISPDLTRIHVPIVTSPEVVFLVNDTAIPLRAGEAWHIDVRFPHQVDNRSDCDRVHLVIDLIANADLQSLLDRSSAVGHGSLLGYFARHALPVPVKRWLHIGN